MPCASFSRCPFLCPFPAGTCSAGYAGGLDPCGQSETQDSTMGDYQVSLSWHLQGSYLRALDSYFHGAQRAPHSPALMAAFHRRITKRGWRRF